MKISKTKIKRNLIRKTNPSIIETINLSRKNQNWLELSKILSSSSRKYSSVNLSDIEKATSIGDTIVVLGKILSLGELSKKIRICSLSISHNAREKLKKTKSEWRSLTEEIKSNPKCEGVKIIK